MAGLRRIINSKFGRKVPDEGVGEYNLDYGSFRGYIEEDPTVIGFLRSLIPTGRQVIDYIISIFPFSQWIFSYNMQWLFGDLVAGITVGLVVIPQGMAYAKLAQLPVQFGLYSSFMGALVYWIFGTSKDINIGPVAVLSIVTGTIVTEAQAQLPPGYEPWVIASALAVLSGSLVTAIGLLRLGWLVDFIALPAVSGFITGSAITIGLGQLPTMLGIKGVSASDPAYKIIIHTCTHLRSIRMDAATGLTALFTLYIIKFSCDRAAKRWPKRSRLIFFFSTMRTVLVLLLFTLISYIVNNHHRRHPSFNILGLIPRGFRDAAPPKIDQKLVKALAPSLPAILVVLLIEHISIAKSFGRVNNYTIDPSQEILAIGVTNVLGPFLGAYPATGSFSRTAIKSKAGVRTPFAGVIAAGVVLLAIYALTPVFFFVPTSSLAAVIIHAVGDLVTPPSTLKRFWQISPTDLVIFFVGLGVIIFSSIEHGVFTMIGLSAALLFIRLFKAPGSFLGTVAISAHSAAPESTLSRSPGSSSAVSVTDSSRLVFLPLDGHDGSNPRIKIQSPGPGVFVYRFSESFSYINANHYIDDMITHVMSETRPTTLNMFARPGDRPWNESRKSKDDIDTKPTLKAIILDFSSVNHIDVTAVQRLVDARNQLDRHTAPNTVQWHFACIYHSRWTKRALAAAGFGYPSHSVIGGQARHWKSIYSVAETMGGDDIESSPKMDQKRLTQDIELAQWHDAQEFVDKQRTSRISFDKPTVVMTERRVETAKAAVHGINRPFFHVSLEMALQCALANAEADPNGS